MTTASRPTPTLPRRAAGWCSRTRLPAARSNPWEEIFQWYIVQDPSFIMEHTNEPVFHDEELDLYVWGITHFGTSWDYVPAPEIH